MITSKRGPAVTCDSLDTPYRWDAFVLLFKASDAQLRTEPSACFVQDHPETDWFMWIDSDTMIINPAFNIPFAKFKGRDLVIWGNETRLLAGDGRSGWLPCLSALRASWSSIASHCC